MIRSIRNLTPLWALVLAPSAGLALPNQNPTGIYGPGVVIAPAGIAVNATGESYVLSSLTRRVEKYSRAGTHLFGWGSQGAGPGQFDYAYGMALDQAGNVFVLDVNACRIQKFSPAGAYLSEFGLPGTGPGQFADPRGIALDGDGNIYVADGGNHRIQKFSYGGTYLSQWGSAGTGPGQFNEPWAIAVDAAGDVYVSDTYNHRIQKFTSSGSFVRMWGSEGTGDGQFEFPSGIVVDGGGNVYVCDTNNSRMEWFTSTGVFVHKWGSPGNGTAQFAAPQGVAAARNGDVYVSDTNNHRVQIYRSRNNQGHEAIAAWGTPGGDNGQFVGITGVAVAPDGSVFVADRVANRVQKFTGYGAWLGAWGSPGNGNGEFLQPDGVAVDTSGFVYVADHVNERVQKFTGTGSYVSQWGEAGSGLGQFTEIWDIAIDAANNVYVTDLNRVQKFNSAGAITGTWFCHEAHGIGTDNEGFVYVACTEDNVVRKFSSNGDPVLEWGSFGVNPGQFNHPTDVVSDTAGYVYVCEEDGNRMQKFTQLGGYIAYFAEPGSGFRETDAPQMMAVDRPGNLYVTEMSNYRVHKFASTPELLEIADVPGDQGGWAKVTFTRSSAEAFESGANPTAYTIHRWEQSPPHIVVVATIPVSDPSTTAIISTEGNATDVFTGMKEYEVRLQTNVPNSVAVREFSDGFSVDNLAPPTPTPFTGEYVSDATHLHWGVSPAPDFSQFRLYREETSEFPLWPATQIHASPDTGYGDVGPAGRYYRIVAADTSGNASQPALLGPNQTVSAPDDPNSLAFRLEEISPNPARGASLYVRFSLPDARAARVDLVDVSGRTYWSREVSGPGPHALRVSHERRLGAGIYFVRLTRDEKSIVRRVAVVD